MVFGLTTQRGLCDYFSQIFNKNFGVSNFLVRLNCCLKWVMVSNLRSLMTSFTLFVSVSCRFLCQQCIVMLVHDDLTIVNSHPVFL